jgi:hypothetical protein
VSRHRERPGNPASVPGGNAWHGARDRKRQTSTNDDTNDDDTNDEEHQDDGEEAGAEERE